MFQAVVEICIVNVRLHTFNNFFMIWDKVALDESDIVQNTRKISSRNCGAVAECNTLFSNILVIYQNIAQYNAVFFYLY